MAERKWVWTKERKGNDRKGEERRKKQNANERMKKVEKQVEETNQGKYVPLNTPTNLSLLTIIKVSTTALRFSMACSACCMRLLPSNPNGFVTTPVWCVAKTV